MRFPFALVVTLLLSAAARADDWPEFRGPDGQGHARGSLPTEWGPYRNVAWKQDIPGEGWSSPVVCEGRVYLTAAVPDSANYSLRVLCLDAKDGKIVWDKEALHEGPRSPKPQAKNSHA